MNRRFPAGKTLMMGALLLVVTARMGGAAPQTTAPKNQEVKSPATRVMGRRLQEKGVPNFGEVTPTLYRGGLLNTTGLKTLAKMGMKVVVDTHANDVNEERTVKSLGMKYVAIPWHCPWPHDEVFAKFLKVLHENKGKKVFVHCRLGDDRTGMMVAAYRMAEEGWTADEAMNEMRTFGFTRAHHFICPGLASYEKHFPERLKDNPAFGGVRAKQSMSGATSGGQRDGK
ncbi:MAG: dual specificity protein phosphatase family protein [Candidatus Sulfotelmatobacter sp.]